MQIIAPILTTTKVTFLFVKKNVTKKFVRKRKQKKCWDNKYLAPRKKCQKSLVTKKKLCKKKGDNEHLQKKKILQKYFFLQFLLLKKKVFFWETKTFTTQKS